APISGLAGMLPVRQITRRHCGDHQCKMPFSHSRLKSSQYSHPTCLYSQPAQFPMPALYHSLLDLHHVATAIRNSGDLNTVLRTAATEVGRELTANCCVVPVGGLVVVTPKTACFAAVQNLAEEKELQLFSDLDLAKLNLQDTLKPWVIDSEAAQ